MLLLNLSFILQFECETSLALTRVSETTESGASGYHGNKNTEFHLDLSLSDVLEIRGQRPGCRDYHSWQQQEYRSKETPVKLWRETQRQKWVRHAVYGICIFENGLETCFVWFSTHSLFWTFEASLTKSGKLKMESVSTFRPHTRDCITLFLLYKTLLLLNTFLQAVFPALMLYDDLSLSLWSWKHSKKKKHPPSRGIIFLAFVWRESVTWDWQDSIYWSRGGWLDSRSFLTLHLFTVVNL